MKNYILPNAAMALALVLGIGATAKAAVTVDLTIVDDTSRAEAGFTGTVPLGSLENNGLYGVYKFNTANASSSSIPGSFWSTCLSPSGNYANGNYTELTYAQANPGINPNMWASGEAGLDWGIQNAQYLWRKYGSGVVSSGNQDAGAGLAMAMYEALYDSTGFGVIGAPNAHFNVSHWVGNSQSYYTADLGGLNQAGVLANYADGYVLVPTGDITWNNGVPTVSGPGQEFILNFSAVPEPTTMIAGALLLLPFGVSTLRRVRKYRNQ